MQSSSHWRASQSIRLLRWIIRRCSSLEALRSAAWRSADRIGPTWAQRRSPTQSGRRATSMAAPPALPPGPARGTRDGPRRDRDALPSAQPGIPATSPAPAAPKAAQGAPGPGRSSPLPHRVDPRVQSIAQSAHGLCQRIQLRIKARLPFRPAFQRGGPARSGPSALILRGRSPSADAQPRALGCFPALTEIWPEATIVTLCSDSCDGV